MPITFSASDAEAYKVAQNSQSTATAQMNPAYDNSIITIGRQIINLEWWDVCKFMYELMISYEICRGQWKDS